MPPDLTDGASENSVEGFRVTPAEGERPGAFVCFPFDRSLVGRFRESFPRARWRPQEECWFVPGTRAVNRLDAWIAQELSALDRHADDKGRDAFHFDPLESPYLEVADDLLVRTPYARRIVDAMRLVPWARWDPGARAWRVPFRSYEALRGRWTEIEEAARENEPEARRSRRDGERSARDAALQSERRRRRAPVLLADPPPLGTPVATPLFGVVVFDEVTGEILDARELPELYAALAGEPGPHGWARWRMPTWRELAAAKPPEDRADARLRTSRGWWLPDAAELTNRRRALREVERARETRARKAESA